MQGRVMWMLWALSVSLAAGRTFTDSEGRAVEAEVMGIRGQMVLLAVNGKTVEFPINKLSVDDQVFIRKWADDLPPTKIHVNIFEREGQYHNPKVQSPTYRPVGFVPPAAPPDMTAKPTHRHYQIDLANQTKLDSGVLEIKYRLFVRSGTGELRQQDGVLHTKDPIKAGARTTLHSDSISTISTKKVSFTTSTDYIPRNDGSGKFDVDTDYRKYTERSDETFGGIWVKVFRNGQLVGESKKLSDAVEKMDPAGP